MTRDPHWEGDGSAIQPIFRPVLRVILAFVIVFGTAGVVYHLMGLDLGGVLFYLSIGAMIVLFTALTTRRSLQEHYGARVVPNGESQRLDQILDDMSVMFHVDRPRLMLVPSEEPNAFTFGFGRRAHVGVTQGLLTELDDSQLRAVIAHEFAHVRNKDCLTQTLAVAVKKALYALTVFLAISIILAGMIIAAILMSSARSKSRRASKGLMILPLAMAAAVCVLSPVAISAGQCLFSRKAELRADELSARITGKPEDLAMALIRMDQCSDCGLASRKHGVYSSLWISSKSECGRLERLMSSHPPIQERVRRLREMDAHRGGSIKADAVSRHCPHAASDLRRFSLGTRL